MPSDSPLCFVLMPFGSKADPSGGPNINFDPIYEQAIKPAIEAAGMEPVRADGERTGGIIHKPMFERLLLCDFAVADLTTGNPNVFYELGVRHAARPATTLGSVLEIEQLVEVGRSGRAANALFIAGVARDEPSDEAVEFRPVYGKRRGR